MLKFYSISYANDEIDVTIKRKLSKEIAVIYFCIHSLSVSLRKNEDLILEKDKIRSQASLVLFCIYELVLVRVAIFQ
jgi:hypothetical protein